MIEDKKYFAIRGYNKSGTNWLCRLLNLHPLISCTGEFHWYRITSQLIQTYNESGHLYGQPGLLGATLQRMDQFIKEAIALACDSDAIWVGDRTPAHIEPSIIVDATIFDMIRDGRDVLVSSAYHFFNNPDFFPEYCDRDEFQRPLKLFRNDPFFFKQNPHELLASDLFVNNVSQSWAQAINANQQKLEAHPEINCMEVRYEELHRDTELVRRKLYEFLEVDPALAEPLSFDTEAGFAKEVPNSFLRKGAVGDWRNYFTPRLQSLFNENAGETLVKLGYAESLEWDSSPSKSVFETRVASDANTTDAAAEPKMEFIPKPKKVASTVGMMCQARSLLAYGGLDGVVQRPMFDRDGGVFPHFAVAADGCRITDSVGRTYIDWMNGWGPVLLGYNRTEVMEAIEFQAKAGPTLSLMHPIEVEVAELLVEMIPGAEMVAFGKNGSDAVNASLRIARAVTGRKMILQCGFHGFHEWYTCLHPSVEGMPDGLREQVEPFPYNDLDALEKLLIKHSGSVAAVIMEPVNLQIPSEGYLEGVKELTKKHGCLFIFDEMVTAFRLANGGAQEYFGVIPDLACIGKGMANGMPLSAVVGKREYMQRLPACGFGMTFRGETFSLAAAKAVLQLLKREPVCKHLASIGQELRERFEAAAKALGMKCVLAGPASRMTIEFHDCGNIPQSTIRNLFLQSCMKHGVITNGTLLPNFAHDQASIDESMVAFEAALSVVAEAIKTGQFSDSRPHGGSPTGPRAFVSNGFLEAINIDGQFLIVHGWMLLEDGAPDSVELVSAEGELIPARCELRQDIEAAFPDQPSANLAGYKATLPASAYTNPENQYEFTIVAKRGSEVAFRCLVVQQDISNENLGGPFSTNDGVLYI